MDFQYEFGGDGRLHYPLVSLSVWLAVVSSIRKSNNMSIITVADTVSRFAHSARAVSTMAHERSIHCGISRSIITYSPFFSFLRFGASRNLLVYPRATVAKRVNMTNEIMVWASFPISISSNSFAP